MNAPLNVFLTIDTEIWPRACDWQQVDITEDFRRDIHGSTAQGDFGVPYQILMLNAYRLKAVFMVEALFPCIQKQEMLRDIVQMIYDGGHDVQLHLHSEWLCETGSMSLPGRRSRYLHDYSEAEQAQLIAEGIRNLKACGVENICAFRAGHYGANFDTLRALARNGIQFDSSYNAPYLNAACKLELPGLLVQPACIDGVYEIPISFFCDYPGHYRHAQLCACSCEEMEMALMQAYRSGWHSFVIVMHSFELLNRGELRGRPVLPDQIVVQRFGWLCRFLSGNRDKFRTCTFAEMDPDSIPTGQTFLPLTSNMAATMGRMLEQLTRRMP